MRRLRRAWGIPLGGSDGPPSQAVEGPTQPVLPVAASCVPSVGRNRELFLVPAHYRPTMDGPKPGALRLVAVLDRGGREVRLLTHETEVTAEARSFLKGRTSTRPRTSTAPFGSPRRHGPITSDLYPRTGCQS